MPCGCRDRQSLPLTAEQIAEQEARAARRQARVEEIARKREERANLRQAALEARRLARQQKAG